jgi:hypothetical protein
MVSLLSCQQTFEAREILDVKEYDQVLTSIAPYVVRKHDDMSYEDRFKPESKSYYGLVMQKTGGHLKFFSETDTSKNFHYSYRDRSSLFEHYKSVGGYYRTDEKGKITFLNILYSTPRFTKEEALEKDPILFKEMVSKGNVASYIGNRKFVHTPNSDFYYNTKNNRWDYTANSSWNFLKTEEQKADSAANE